MRRKNKVTTLSGIILIVLCVTVFYLYGRQPETVQTAVENAAEAGENKMTVHFIDVGQADSILITSEGSAMLIDAGNNDDGELVEEYLKAQGVERLDYVIGTHPHEDHIGGLDDVISDFDVGTVIMPKKETDTVTFSNVLDAIADKGLTITQPVTGNEYSLGSATFTILGPNDDYGDDLNNWSVGVKIACGDNSFVMCGDAEETAEEDIIATGLDLTADVLKLGHHGSSTSTCDDFLQAVSPDYGVISCGADNKYGHPHDETLEKLNASGVEYFRTDLQGTVVAQCGDDAISWSADPVEVK